MKVVIERIRPVAGHLGLEPCGAIAVVGGVVYVGSFDTHLYALDLKDGKEKWKYKGGPFKPAVSVHKGLIYAGDEDGVVKPIRSRDMVAALKAAGGKPRYTEFITTGHDSWVQAYRNPEMYEWLFSQKKP